MLAMTNPYLFICLHSLYCELVGRMTNLAGQGVFAGIQEKRRVYCFWKKEQATQEEHINLIRSCREKIRDKSLVRNQFGHSHKRQQKQVSKYINNKKTAKENVHSLLDVAGNIATKDEEKAEILIAFFASVFNSQTYNPQGIQLTVLEKREREQNKPPLIQEEAINNLTCYTTQTLTNL